MCIHYNLRHLTCHRYVYVQIQALFLLFFQERQQSLEVLHPSRRQSLSQFLEVRHPLRADRSELHRNTYSVPFLHRTRRRHETQLTAEYGGVLQAEECLHLGQIPSRATQQDPVNLPVLGLHQPRAHAVRQGPCQDGGSELRRAEGDEEYEGREGNSGGYRVQPTRRERTPMNEVEHDAAGKEVSVNQRTRILLNAKV